jgi:hypothetical protein
MTNKNNDKITLLWTKNSLKMNDTIKTYRHLLRNKNPEWTYRPEDKGSMFFRNLVPTYKCTRRYNPKTPSALGITVYKKNKI